MRIKNILLLFCVLLPLSARAQFVEVNWSSEKGDSLLPLCTSVVELPADYASYCYSAHVEYPEYQRMTAEEVARYSLADKYASLPVHPSVECHVGVQAKQPQLDIFFIPVVMRDGAYYRLNSYKLVVDRTPLPQRAARATRSAAERYASSSLLADGRWVRVSVSENGVHKITHNELRKMGFKDPAKVRLYGYGGHILPEKGLETLVDDLCEVPLWREEGYVLFYANGVLSWRHDGANYVRVQNVYSEYGCYFLTESEEAPMEFPRETLQTTVSQEYTTFTDYAIHENDAKSLCSYGRELVDDYDYSRGRSVSYKIPVTGVVEGNASLELSFATNGIEQSRVAVSVGDKNVGTLLVGRAVSGEVGKIVTGRFGVSDLADNPVIKLSHSVTNNTLTGHLNYITLNFKRALALYGSQTLFRGNIQTGNALFKVVGAGADTRVWDVSSSSSIKELGGTLEGAVYSVVGPASLNSNMVAVNIKGKFPSVRVMGEVPNQNLHAMGQTDMVIIIPSNGKFMDAAERLAEAHRSADGITVEVVTAQQVYNEFSSGTPDVTAYRRLMKMLYDRAATADDAPKYLLLMGDAWYDNRLITFPGRSQEDYLLCYESVNSVDAIQSYVLEDYMGYLDDGEGSNHNRDKVDIGIGRLPVQSVGEADGVVAKILAYIDNKSAGAWQNVVSLLADDGDAKMPNQHMKDADSIAAVMERNYPLYSIDRIFWDDFPYEPSASGIRYPVVTQAIYDRLEKGALVVNYSGHGGPNLMSHEMVWKASDMAAVNSPRVPFWVTASCDIGPFDLGDNSVAENAILNPNGAAIGLFTTTRTVLQSYNSIINKAFMKELLASSVNGKRVAVGDAVRRAKCNVITAGSDYSVNKLQFVLLGDPALRLKTPEYRVVIDEFNGVRAGESSMVSAGSLLKVSGHVTGFDGQPASDFNGTLYSTLFDSAEDVYTRDNAGLGSYKYTAFKKTLFSGSDSIVGGRFSVTLPVPMDISYSNEQGALNLFAVDSSMVRLAQGRYDDFVVGGTSQDMSNDGKGPEISLYLNTPSFVDGDEVNSTPCLWAEIYDENGINTIGTGIGHDMIAIVDNSPKHTYNLNNIFTPAVGDYRRGTVMLPLNELEEGEHSLILRAWDLYNNSTTANLTFVVNPSLAPDFVQLRINPSPVLYGTSACFELTHNRPQSELEARIDIFNFQGQVLWSRTSRELADSLVLRCEWDGTAQGGQPLPTGVYLARAYIVSDGAESTTRTIKFVVINNK
ncbi:MAG: type IX secretion system sortase PorU [Bacteroidaceae bacterium]|nr:type IX secretion system sortase PorU [Bacteroidaceae bacterium]